MAPDKTALRTTIRARRRARRVGTDAGARAQAANALADHTRQLMQRWRLHSGVVTAYDARPTEPPTDALVEALHGAGWRVLMPVTLPDRDLSWRAVGEETDLGPGAIADADLVLVPALAVDVRGHRLGQGGGSYDRALPRRRPGVRVVAVVWDDEVLSDVPTQPHDQPVDAAVTPEQVREFAR